MALGELRLKDWWRVCYREVLAGLALGTILGTVGWVRVWFFPVQSGLEVYQRILVATTVAISLLGTVLWGTITGSLLPFILRSLRLDPATASAPFVATLVDVTGIVIYFTVAGQILAGRLI
jgi:magnesium transporter